MKEFLFTYKLTRVRQTNLPLSEKDRNKTENGSSLFEDFAYIDRENKTFLLGRLQRMQRNFDTGKSKITVDYKDTVSFDAKFLKEINLSFVQYQQTSESKYSLNTFEVSTVNASDVICHVNLMYQLGAYTLLEEGKTVIHEAIQKHFKIVLYHGIMRVAQQHDSVYLRNSMDDFLTVVPTVADNGRRVSTRTRKQIHYVSY